MKQDRKLKVKICGMKYRDNIKEVSRLNPDYLGFIFHPLSPRYCQAEGKEILRILPREIIPVMVTVDMPEEKLIEIAEEWGFKIVQLHGNETPDTCGRIRDRGLEVWKAFPIGKDKDESSIGKVAQYEGKVDMMLFDTATKAYGGSGKKFDWKAIDDYKGDTPFILSGGIAPGDESDILRLTHPKLVGVDLNSRFEINPGLKNPQLLSIFLSTIKSK